MRPPSFRLKSSYNDLKLFTIGVDFLERLYGDRLQKRWPCRRCRSVRCQGGSDVKVGQATRRNRAGVEQACIDLRQASVTSLPFPDGSFTRALALHSIYFWPSIDLALRELYRVLRPSGRLAIGVRMQEPDAGPFNPARYGLTAYQLEALQLALGAVGFTVLDTQIRKLNGQIVAAVLAGR